MDGAERKGRPARCQNLGLPRKDAGTGFPAVPKSKGTDFFSMTACAERIKKERGPQMTAF